MREAHRALRIEAEVHLFTHFQIRESAGLRQRDPELEASQILVQQHS